MILSIPNPDLSRRYGRRRDTRAVLNAVRSEAGKRARSEPEDAEKRDSVAFGEELGGRETVLIEVVEEGG